MTTKSSPQFSHLDEQGAARMVDVSGKPVQVRRATAEGLLVCKPETILALRDQALPKGDVLATARIAGILAAKQTSDLIPLCHPLPLQHLEIQFEVFDEGIRIRCTVQTEAKTGVEMEALTGVSVAALTLYDMCKAVDKSMRIDSIRVTEKTKK
jgi:cyclic pyranopterin phosphate synthase